MGIIAWISLESLGERGMTARETEAQRIQSIIQAHKTVVAGRDCWGELLCSCDPRSQKQKETDYSSQGKPRPGWIRGWTLAWTGYHFFDIWGLWLVTYFWRECVFIFSIAVSGWLWALCKWRRVCDLPQWHRILQVSSPLWFFSSSSSGGLFPSVGHWTRFGSTLPSLILLCNVTGSLTFLI